MEIFNIIKNEVNEYQNNSVEITKGVYKSADKRKKRLSYFMNRGGDTNKINEYGQYQYWLDPTKLFVDTVTKNLKLDTRNILAYSEDPIGDFGAVFIFNIILKDRLTNPNSNKDNDLKEDIESFVAWGNILWERTKDGFQTCDLLDTYVLNQRARSVDESDIIRRFELTQTDLRRMEGTYKDIEKAIKNSGDKFLVKEKSDTATKPIYEVFMRTGEVSEKVLFEAQGKKGGDDKKMVFCRIVVVGLSGGKDEESGVVLLAEGLGDKKMSNFYKEAHFGSYNKTWFREGVMEPFIDYIIAIREIDNYIQDGIEWASKIVFRASDNKTFQNIRTDIENGRLINSKDLSQVDVRFHNLDQMIARRNNLIDEMEKMSHALDVAQGQTMPSGTPFLSVAKLDENVSKYYSGKRDKFAIGYKHLFEEWEVPNLIKDISKMEVISITGEEAVLDRYYDLVVKDWYNKNLVAIGPHTQEMKEMLLMEKKEELKQFRPSVANNKEIWKDITKRIRITITGEESNILDNLSTIASLLQVEQDISRRNYLLDRVYAMKGIPVPPVTPQQEVEQRPHPTNLSNKEVDMVASIPNE